MTGDAYVSHRCGLARYVSTRLSLKAIWLWSRSLKRLLDNFRNFSPQAPQNSLANPLRTKAQRLARLLTKLESETARCGGAGGAFVDGPSALFAAETDLSRKRRLLQSRSGTGRVFGLIEFKFVQTSDLNVSRARLKLILRRIVSFFIATSSKTTFKESTPAIAPDDVVYFTSSHARVPEIWLGPSCTTKRRRTSAIRSTSCTRNETSLRTSIDSHGREGEDNSKVVRVGS